MIVITQRASCNESNEETKKCHILRPKIPKIPAIRTEFENNTNLSAIIFRWDVYERAL